LGINRKIKGEYNDHFRYIKAGKLKAYKIGKEFRIGKEEFNNFLNKTEIK